MTDTTKQIKQKYGDAYVTDVKITDVHLPRDGDVHPMTSVRGYFEFDGRIRSGQKGRFWTKIVPGDLVTRTETNFTVKVIKTKHTQWREMKSCEQKSSIQMELTAHVMNHLEREQNENVLENDSENEFGVDRERELAVEAALENGLTGRIKDPDALAAAMLESGEVEVLTVESAVDLNDMVAKAAVKDSDDLLEIPSFLKRS